MWGDLCVFQTAHAPLLHRGDASAFPWRAPDSLRLRLRLGRAAQREDARAQGPTALAANAEAQTQGTHTVGRGLPARARSGRQRGPRDRVSQPAGWAALHCHQDSGGLTAAVRVLGGHEAEFPELGAEDPSVASF